MSAIYEGIGRLVVWFIRYRYGRQLRVVAGIGLVGFVTLLVGAYLAASHRDVEEG